MSKILKVKLPSDYPPEDGCYLRGNDYSPVAVVILLHTRYEAIPDFLQNLAKVAVEAGAALAGFLQTENIGIEKIVCNIVANPNIRYIVLCGVESAGHWPGDAFICFIKNGVDEKRFIIGSKAPTPYLYNISLEAIERFRKQITLINLLSEEDRKIRIAPEVMRKAVWACIQEQPTKFLNYTVYDSGAYPEPPMCEKITWRITKPWAVYSETEAKEMVKIKEAAALKAKEEDERRQKIEESKVFLQLLFPKGRRREDENHLKS
ncbi:tetrahydromethanopterin S-methyltransferase subunit A [Candidatus Bathyarchaeota archaeon]|nr:tetrahydromethanopterin S-methyltransferase subunit A [Candidatus Bathyarchaeota archaeon]